MINDLEIINFQSHKNTTLEFSPGVNVILGQSDVGKSTIIRAITWAVNNRPSGENTEVAIAFGEEFVSRQKGKKINGYSTGQDDYKALRTDVPDGVKTITRMEEVNIQPQYKSYFLLDETPGNVAKAFNSVSGLEEMDAALKNVNSRVRSTSSDLAKNLKDTVAIEEQIDNLSWVSGAKKCLASLEKQDKTLTKANDDKYKLGLLLAEIKTKQRKLNDLPDFSALHKINEIFILDKTIDAKLVTQNNLFTLLETLSKRRKKQKRYDVLDQCSLSNTAEISQQINTKFQNILSLSGKIGELEEKKHMLSRNAVEVKERISAVVDIEMKLEVCPTCNQYILEES